MKVNRLAEESRGRSPCRQVGSRRAELLPLLALVLGALWLLIRPAQFEGQSLEGWLKSATNTLKVAGAVRVFSTYPDESIPFLAKKLRQDEPLINRLLQHLAKAAPFAKRWLPPPIDRQVKERTAWLLGQIEPVTPVAVALLVDALSDKQTNVRLCAALALKEMGASAELAIPALVDRLGDGPVMSTAITAVVGIQQKLALSPGQSSILEQKWPEILQALTNGWTSYAFTLVSTLGSNGAPALPAIRGLLQSSKRYGKRQAIEAIGEIGIADAETIALIIRAAPDRSKSVGRCAVEVLNSLGHPEAAREAEDLICLWSGWVVEVPK